MQRLLASMLRIDRILQRRLSYLQHPFFVQDKHTAELCGKSIDMYAAISVLRARAFEALDYRQRAIRWYKCGPLLWARAAVNDAPVIAAL
jgi:hypothetical protein